MTYFASSRQRAGGFVNTHRIAAGSTIGVVLAAALVSGAIGGISPARAEANLTPDDGGAPKLAPHRAVYDLALRDAATGSGIVGADGRIVYEATGNACEGYSVTYRFVSRLRLQNGATRLIDSRAASFEDPQSQRFTFLIESRIDGRVVEDTKGEAIAVDGGIQASVEPSQPEKLMLSGETLFPSAHLLMLIAAAQDGERFMMANFYDGSNGGKTVFNTTAVIGPPLPPLADAQGAEAVLGDRLFGTRWRVSLAYFPPTEPGVGEILPDYQIAMDLYEDGIARALILDHGDFTLSADLVELERLPQSPCE